jgi:DNA replication protein DnaC
MERSQILETMSGLKLFGMKAAYDEIIATAVKRQHEPQQIVSDLLAAEIAEKQARSIKYQMTTARLPLAKDLGDFTFDGTPINAALVHDLAGGEFLAHERNVVLVGGTGTGKSHLAIAIARACIRNGARGRFFNVVDLVNKLEAERRAARQGRMADYLSRWTSSSWTSSATCRSPNPMASSCSTSSAASTSRLPSSSPPTWRSASGRACSATPR